MSFHCHRIVYWLYADTHDRKDTSWWRWRDLPVDFSRVTFIGKCQFRFSKQQSSYCHIELSFFYLHVLIEDGNVEIKKKARPFRRSHTSRVYAIVRVKDGKWQNIYSKHIESKPHHLGWKFREIIKRFNFSIFIFLPP